MARWGHTMDASIGISPLWGIPNKHIEQMRFAHSSCAGRYVRGRAIGSREPG